VVPHIGTVTLPGVNHGDLLKAFAQIGIERVDFRLAKMPGNRQVLLRPQARDVQYQGFMLNKCRFKPCQGIWQEYASGIQIKYLGANTWPQGADGES